MKQHDYVANPVQFDKVAALAPNLLRAQEVSPTRCERARTARHIESIVPRDLQNVCEKLVGRLLQSTVGARDDQSVWTIWRPFPECDGDDWFRQSVIAG